MKNFKISVIIIALFAVGSSCKKDTNTKVNTGVAATVSASNYGFDGGAGSAFKSTAAGMVSVAGTFTISAIKDGTSQSLSIVLLGTPGVGTFSLDQGNASGSGAVITKDYNKPTDNTLSYTTDNTDGHGVKGGGQLKITKFTDTEAEGTFYFTGYNSVGKAAFVEQGTFSGKYNKH